ncbi:MAG: hypothetical protein ABIH92_02975 [Nanoarchaeota archaeon]
MKKEVAMKSGDNSFGVASVILGLLSLLLSLALPSQGVLLGIIGLIFANRQKKLGKTRWSHAGKILSIIGIIISLVLLVLLVWVAQNPEILTQFGGQYPNV